MVVLPARSPGLGGDAGRQARRAVATVRAVLPRWPGRLAIEVPSTVASYEAALGASPGERADDAAVTFGDGHHGTRIGDERAKLAAVEPFGRIAKAALFQFDQRRCIGDERDAQRHRRFDRAVEGDVRGLRRRQVRLRKADRYDNLRLAREDRLTDHAAGTIARLGKPQAGDAPVVACIDLGAVRPVLTAEFGVNELR